MFTTKNAHEYLLSLAYNTSTLYFKYLWGNHTWKIKCDIYLYFPVGKVCGYVTSPNLISASSATLGYA